MPVPSRARSSRSRCQPSISIRRTSRRVASRTAAIAHLRAGAHGSGPFRFWRAVGFWPWSSSVDAAAPDGLSFAASLAFGWRWRPVRRRHRSSPMTRATRGQRSHTKSTERRSNGPWSYASAPTLLMSILNSPDAPPRLPTTGRPTKRFSAASDTSCRSWSSTGSFFRASAPSQLGSPSVTTR